MSEIKRNDPCICGSGKKYKKCCMLKEVAPVGDFVRQKINRTLAELLPVLEKHAKQYYGDEAIYAAIHEYFCFQGVPDDEYLDMELGEIFQCWFNYNWIPDILEKDAPVHFPGHQIALDYLQKKGGQLPVFTRRLIEQACDTQYSFYLIKEVDPGHSLVLMDLLLEQTITVLEKSASMALSSGDILFARIITMDATSVMLGCSPIPIPASYQESIVDFREDKLSRV
ncbi:MAG: SEC-C metal-binding domain-containing protein, partial [Gammaproteobacteria bacterium]|nr:SEC-C metal-binding domain-containing protein [Gammaproteobacteria bacterium]